MRCCSAQIGGVWESPEKTLEMVENIFYNAAQSGAALISFPEQFATCWDPVSTKNIESLTGPTVTGLSRLVKKTFDCCRRLIP
jgi:predicted amidohydrolase